MAVQIGQRIAFVLCYGMRDIDPACVGEKQAKQIQGSIVKICEGLGGVVENNDFSRDELDPELEHNEDDEPSGGVIIVFHFDDEAAADKAVADVLETWGSVSDFGIHYPDADEDLEGGFFIDDSVDLAKATAIMADIEQTCMDAGAKPMCRDRFRSFGLSGAFLRYQFVDAARLKSARTQLRSRWSEDELEISGGETR